jgi:hypothetical protein
LIAETLEARYGQTNEEALAREHLERKRIRKPENEKETARVMRRLVTAGFSTGHDLQDSSPVGCAGGERWRRWTIWMRRRTRGRPYGIGSKVNPGI